MKKFLITLLTITVIIGICGVGYFAYRSNILDRDAKEVISDLGKQMNVTAAFEFEVPKIKNKTEVVKADGNKKVIPLYLGNGKYYNVHVPADASIVTDYATYIYGTDMTFKVSVVSNINPNDIPKSLVMSDVIDYGNNIWITKTGIKRPQEVGAPIFDNYAILAIAYDAPQTYATLLNGIEQETVRSYEVHSLTGDKYTNYCNSIAEIPYDSGSGTNSLLSEYKDAGAYMYRYEDGWLTEFNATQGNEAMRTDVLTRALLASSSTAHLDRVFNGNDGRAEFYYAEVGNCTILCVSDTINHTYACLGYGNTAKQDIITYLRNVYSQS